MQQARTGSAAFCPVRFNSAADVSDKVMVVLTLFDPGVTVEGVNTGVP